ncbi:hypothetical protein CHLNCDRAFT_139077 [Chlorella variabilis]|uniref:Sugar phosphate transporter domain-containing protein n=1 Tax=Chlorella variabilis TaxID=554065 RepID=E1ZPB3_CHLVA|nr:hypothetical protein CHLNCDRAFT_139077 [Chlorella variabilis]EFN52306.1 hypothetical protein CHLNCDRAFT_139077 [Chlorella variabilis]|eukprot:XP_005844408.1 hypothetical protein CHLNCDRAFT_139077 [Chlorella variabilis]
MVQQPGKTGQAEQHSANGLVHAGRSLELTGLERLTGGLPAAMSAALYPKGSLLDLFWTVFLVGVWYFSNFQFGFGLKRTSNRFQNLELCVFLLWVLFTVGWAVSWAVRLAYTHVFTKKAECDGMGSPRRDEEAAIKHHNDHQLDAEQAAVASNHLTTVAVHTLGMSFTCLAFIAGSVPVVQVFKSLAPIFTTIFSMCYLSAVFPYSAVAAVMLLVGSATLSSWNTPGFNLTAVLMCMVTNLSLPLRNVMVKQHTVLRQTQLAAVGKAGPNSVRLALDTAVDLNFGGMVILTPLCLIFMSSLEVPAEDVAIALRLGMHRIIYEIASLMVLTRIDAVMHGSLDVLKRAAMTLIALSSFEAVHPLNLAGSLFAFATLLWYKLSVSKQASAGASGRAFYLPDRWRGKVAGLLKLTLCCVATFALRLFIQARTKQQGER